MVSNPLGNLKIDNWYKALLVIGSCVFLVSLSTEVKGIENSVVQLISLGCILFGLGEWINHPYQEIIVPGGKISGYPRKNKVGGIVFDIIGIIFVIFGVIKFL